LIRTLGIDLASQPKDTAACVIEWGGPVPRTLPALEFLGGDRLDDACLLDLIQHEGIGRIAIDAPFGWPAEFVDAITIWQNQQEWPVPPGDPARQQARLVLRETDREVHRATGLSMDPDAIRTGKWPLSVSTDKLGITAMRCMRLLAEVQRREDRQIDRSGNDRIIEVYPDATLREWGCWPSAWDVHPRRGYKGTKAIHLEGRRELMSALVEKAPWLGRDSQLQERCVASDDELDALVSALMARVADQGNVQGVGDSARARLEGWICLPQPGSLSTTAD